MGNVDILEAANGGPFRYRLRGEIHAADDPAEMPFQLILAILQAECIPTAPNCSVRQLKRLVRSWAAHYDLPEFGDAQRLTYLVDHYRSALVYDLRHHLGADLGDLWRARRWRTLLDYIDRLPGHSWYSSAVATDEEHAKMIAESLARRESDGEKTPEGPPLHTWTPELAEMRALRDDVRALHYLIPASQGDKKVQPPPALPRPHTPLEAAIKRANHQRRQESHNALVARLLPHKAAKNG